MTAPAPKPSEIKTRPLPTKQPPKIEKKVSPQVQSPQKKEAPKEVKKPFVRKPHLTDNPFRNNADLQALKRRLR